MTDADRDDLLTILLAWMEWPLCDEVEIPLPSGGTVSLWDHCVVYDNPKRADIIPLRGQEFRVGEIVDSLKDDERPLPPAFAEEGIHLASIMEDGKGRIITYDTVWYLEFVTSGLDSEESEFQIELDRQRLYRRIAAKEN